MDTVKLLNNVKERLFEKGWQQGDYGDSYGPNCLVGAVRETLGMSLYSRKESQKQPYDETLRALCLAIYGPEKELLLTDCDVIDFNDEGETTFNDVVDVLDRAIKNEETNGNH